MANTQTSSDLHALFQPVGGLFNGYTRFRAATDEPPLFTRVERLGSIGQIWGHVGHKRRFHHGRESIEGAGVGLDESEATIRARAEALERYCACVFADYQCVRA